MAAPLSVVPRPPLNSPAALATPSPHALAPHVMPATAKALTSLPSVMRRPHPPPTLPAATHPAPPLAPTPSPPPSTCTRPLSAGSAALVSVTASDEAVGAEWQASAVMRAKDTTASAVNKDMEVESGVIDEAAPAALSSHNCVAMPSERAARAAAATGMAQTLAQLQQQQPKLPSYRAAGRPPIPRGVHGALATPSWAAPPLQSPFAGLSTAVDSTATPPPCRHPRPRPHSALSVAGLRGAPAGTVGSGALNTPMEWPIPPAQPSPIAPRPCRRPQSSFPTLPHKPMLPPPPSPPPSVQPPAPPLPDAQQETIAAADGNLSPAIWIDARRAAPAPPVLALRQHEVTRGGGGDIDDGESCGPALERATTDLDDGVLLDMLSEDDSRQPQLGRTIRPVW